MSDKDKQKKIDILVSKIYYVLDEIGKDVGNAIDTGIIFDTTTLIVIIDRLYKAKSFINLYTSADFEE